MVLSHRRSFIEDLWTAAPLFTCKTREPKKYFCFFIANNGYGCSAMSVFLIRELPAQRQFGTKGLETSIPDNMFRRAGIR